MPVCTTLTETSLDRFYKFIKYLADNNLLDESYEYLKTKGHENIRVSIEPITDIQEMLTQKHGGLNNAPDTARVIIQSSHNNC